VRAAAFLRSCFATPLNAALTLAALALLAWTIPPLIEWALFDAIWTGRSGVACQGHDGACWPFVRQRLDQLLGGLKLNIVVAAWTIASAIPLGFLLALGRRSELPVISLACATFIELWRSLPLIGILFIAVVLFPLFVPPGVEIDKLVRALIAFTLFNAANFAEVFRGGLQAIPAGQSEAARSLGLGYWRATGLIIVPQVVRITLPALINTCVSIIKETTIILVIGLLEFLGELQAAMADPEWLIADQVRNTGYFFAALIFWALCFSLSRYSVRLERAMSPTAAGGTIRPPAPSLDR
jgi:general L-amino acid transport system permease protein